MQTRSSVKVMLVIAMAVVALATMPRPAAAQGVGLKIGVNFSKIKFDPAEAAGDLDRRTGVVVGIYGPPRGNALMEWQTELFYVERGAKSKASDGSTLRLSYLVIPILERIRLSGASDVQVHFLVGPELAYRLKAQLKNGSDTVDYNDAIKIYDLGIAAGIDVQISHLVLDARYTWGLVNINRTSDDSTKLKNRVLTFMVGFRGRD
jgi:Outer membrane protein beta-barrel domain